MSSASASVNGNLNTSGPANDVRVRVRKRLVLANLPTSHFSEIASCILPRLYLTDFATACNEKQLRRLQITHIVSLLEWNITAPEDIDVLRIPIADSFKMDILSHLDKTTEFITVALAQEGTNVMVHCFQGISRSATVVCAYLIAEKGMSAAEAIAFVQERRPIIKPNFGFVRQLIRYAERYGHAASKAEEQGLHLGMSRLTLSGRLTPGEHDFVWDTKPTVAPTALSQDVSCRAEEPPDANLQANPSLEVAVGTGGIST